MKQRAIFRQHEADAWFERNRERLGAHDPVMELIDAHGIRPKRVLEVGCADGWRLKKIATGYGARVTGVDPSARAATEADTKHRVRVLERTADDLPGPDGFFDLVIFGFCLYVTDPEDWFKIAYEGDRVLATGGHLIIHDFAATIPFARNYEYQPQVLAWHFDFSKLWLAHPLYTEVARRLPADDQMVTILQKQPKAHIKVLP